VPPPKPPPKQKTAAPVRTEQAIISTIQTELATVREELSPAVDHLLASAAAKQTPRPKEHIRLSELLLQSLLRLDAIVTDGEWDTARKERKAAVKEVQALLDRCWCFFFLANYAVSLTRFFFAVDGSAS
jgi:hypothetical protein